MNEITLRDSSARIIDSMFQGDKNRTLMISGIYISDELSYKIHFDTHSAFSAYTVTPTVQTVESDEYGEFDALVCTVPNDLIEFGGKIHVFVCEINADTNERRTIGAAWLAIVGKQALPAG